MDGGISRALVRVHADWAEDGICRDRVWKGGFHTPDLRQLSEVQKKV